MSLGSAKSSSGSTPSESSSEDSSGVIYDSSSGSSGSSASSESSSSSSCQCGFSLFELILDVDSISAGEFTVENTGCGDLTVTTLEGLPGGVFLPALPVTIPEGSFFIFHYEVESTDIRGTTITVTTDCGEPQSDTWPLS